MDFDYAIINSTVDPLAAGAPNTTGTNSTASSNSASSSSASSTASASSNAGSSSNGSTSTKSTNTGAIAGGVVGGVVALALVTFAIWWFVFRRRANRSNKSNQRSFMEGVDPEPLNTGTSQGHYSANGGFGSHQNQFVTPYDPTFHSNGNLPPGAGSPRSSQMTQTHNLHPSFLSGVPPPPASNATSYPYSIQPPSSAAGGDVDSGDPFTSGNSPTPASDPSSTGAATASPPVRPVATGTKTRGVALPYTAVPPRADSSVHPTDSPRTDSTVSSHSSSQRMQRDRRETDMGPLSEGLQSPGLLPPDYQQAIQPLPGQSPTSDEHRQAS